MHGCYGVAVCHHNAAAVSTPAHDVSHHLLTPAPPAAINTGASVVASAAAFSIPMFGHSTNADLYHAVHKSFAGYKRPRNCRVLRL